MLCISLFVLALAADPQPKQQTAPQVTSTSLAEKPSTEQAREPKELRDALRAALRSTAKSWKAKPEEAAHALLPLFVEIKLDKQMVKADRDSYAIVLRNRLKKIGDLLAARRKLEKPKVQENSSQETGQVAQLGSVTAPSTTVAGAAGGRMQQDYGQDLVALIEKTIAPDTWDVNGGPGSIVYYQPLRVIVVRQTGEIHEQLGGVLGQLKK